MVTQEYCQTEVWLGRGVVKQEFGQTVCSMEVVFSGRSVFRQKWCQAEVWSGRSVIRQKCGQA